MRKGILCGYDLQLFADEEVADGENASDVANQTEETENTESEVEETGEETNGNAAPLTQSDEENARYANIRRKAEEDAQRKYASMYDAQFAELCRGINHPVTGRPITTAAEYIDAIRQQEKIANENELRNKGVDPDLVNKMIEQNPLIQQARAVIEKSKIDDADMQLRNDILELGKFNPDIKGIEDVQKLENFDEILYRVQNGANLVDAYKAANFDLVMKHQNESGRQQAINEIRGKSHLGTPNGVAVVDSGEEVPTEILNRYRSEGKTDKQIKELYNSVLKKLHAH